MSITDDLGRTLVRPMTVNSRSADPFRAELDGAVRIYLEQAALADEEDCGNGEANPAWGDLTFVSE